MSLAEVLHMIAAHGGSVTRAQAFTCGKTAGVEALYRYKKAGALVELDDGRHEPATWQTVRLHEDDRALLQRLCEAVENL